MRRGLAGFVLGLILAACGQTAPASQAPTPETHLHTTALPSSTATRIDATTATVEVVPSVTAESSLELAVVDFPAARSASLVASGDAVYVALGQGESILVARSLDGGLTFEEPVRANPDVPAYVMPIERPAIAADDEGRVSVGWLELSPEGAGKVWYGRSEDGGQSFGTSVAVMPAFRPHPTLLSLALDEAESPVLTWLEGHGSLAVARSRDGGKTFPVNRVMESLVCDCCQPQPMARNGQIWVAYRNVEDGENGADVRDLYVLRSEDDGETFDGVRVSDAPWTFPACPVSGPTIAADEDALYVAWMDGRNDANGDLSRTDIWFAASTDGGETFSPNVRVNPEGAGERYHNLPALAVGRDRRLHMVWEADDGNRFALVYAASADGGATWAPPQVVVSSEDGTGRGRPQYAVLGVSGAGRLHLSWVDTLGAHVASWDE